MTGPLIVDPDQVDSAGATWWKLTPEFGAPPPSVSGSGPESLAAQEAIAAAQAATHNLQQGLGQTAGTAQGAAGAYQTQETQSAHGMEPKDQIGVMKDLIGVGTGLFGVLPQVLGSGTALVGAGTGAIGAGAGTIGSLTGAAVSGQKLSQPQGESNSGGGWNPNNNNSEGSQDNTHPEPGTHTVAAAVPAAALQQEQPERGYLTGRPT